MRNMCLLAGALTLWMSGCSEDPPQASSDLLGMDSLSAKKKERAKKRRKVEPILPKEAHSDRPAGRAAIALHEKSFGEQARDPFEDTSDGPVKSIRPELPTRRQREVRFSGYDFEDLRLIAIVRSKKSIPPRALFVASDGVSRPIHQGEYFSRNELLLASVNSDYVEIEVVDEEMAQGLDMEQGERRAIYLKQD